MHCISERLRAVFQKRFDATYPLIPIFGPIFTIDFQYRSCKAHIQTIHQYLNTPAKPRQTYRPTAANLPLCPNYKVMLQCVEYIPSHEYRPCKYTAHCVNTRHVKCKDTQPKSRSFQGWHACSTHGAWNSETPATTIHIMSTAQF